MCDVVCPVLFTWVALQHRADYETLRSHKPTAQ